MNPAFGQIICIMIYILLQCCVWFDVLDDIQENLYVSGTPLHIEFIHAFLLVSMVASAVRRFCLHVNLFAINAHFL